MGALMLTQRGARLHVRGGALVVMIGDRVIAERAPHDVSDVAFFGDTDMTPDARALLFKHRIEAVWLTVGGHYRGRLSAFESTAGERRVAQIVALSDPRRLLETARAIASGKVRNQRALLQRVERERRSAIDSSAVEALGAVIRRLDVAPDTDTVRGLEGYAATIYFRGFAAAISNPHFRFEGRTRRPPRDPVNAMLSFGYALLLSRVDGAVRAAGLDPYVGALHETGRGRASLVLDLMEEFRPAVIDRLVLRLVNRAQLDANDFVEARSPDDDGLGIEPGETGTDRGVWLGESNRNVMLREVGELWRHRVNWPADNTSRSMGDIVLLQAQALARHFERGQPYVAFAMR